MKGAENSHRRSSAFIGGSRYFLSNVRGLERAGRGRRGGLDRDAAEAVVAAMAVLQLAELALVPVVDAAVVADDAGHAADVRRVAFAAMVGQAGRDALAGVADRELRREGELRRLGVLEGLADEREDAVGRGANCLVATCPMCQMNMDAYQNAAGDKSGLNERLPVYFITELIGVSMGISAAELQLDRHFIEATALLRELNLL